eukprot:760599-Hanusia_phi.AAC.3
MGPRSSPLVAGHTEQQQTLARELAELKGMEDSVIFPCGFAANTAVFSLLGAGEDVEVFSDELNHASIIDGLRLASPPGEFVGVLHCGEEDRRVRFAVQHGWGCSADEVWGQEGVRKGGGRKEEVLVVLVFVQEQDNDVDVSNDDDDDDDDDDDVVVVDDAAAAGGGGGGGGGGHMSLLHMPTSLPVNFFSSKRDSTSSLPSMMHMLH